MLEELLYPLTAGIVIETKSMWDELQSSLHDLPVRIIMEQSEIGDLATLIERVERMRPDVIFLDISALREPLDQVIRKIRASANGCAVLALNTTAEPAAILDAMRSGAAEYLYPPMREQVRAALERIGTERKKTNQSLRLGGRTIGFLSAKGGCGATTVACHTAVELPKFTNSHVLLADLDFDSGMVAFLLKTGSKYNIGDAVWNTQRLDANYWKALVTNGIPGLEIISAPVPTSCPPLKLDQLRIVLSFVRTQYDWVVLDLGSGLSPSVLAALDEIDDLYIVTTLEVPALHQAKTIIQRLVESGVQPSRLHLVLNRAPKRYDITMDELETMLGTPVYAVVPNDYVSLNDSYTDGKLLPAGSALNKHFASFAMKLAGVETTAKKKKFSLWAGA
jgi:pilus assembly protein CpaE